MIWLAWRQFRAAALSAAAALAALVVVLAATGPGLRDELSAVVEACQERGMGGGGACGALSQQFFYEHRLAFLAVSALVLVTPAVVGIFWGAPLVARELETGTHRLAWNQSITRARWLAVKLGVVGLGSIVVAGAVGAAVTWWAEPLDTVAVDDFPRMDPVIFAARGVVPVGYAAVAFAVGVIAGILVQRTVPAMAVTLAVLVAVQIAAPLGLRAHLLPPVRATVEISDASPLGFKVSRVGPDGVALGAGESGAWLLSSRTVDASGQAVETMDVSLAGPCVSANQDRDACFAEMRGLGYRLEAVYQPADRFWALQLRETGICAALALALAGFGVWRVRRPL